MDPGKFFALVEKYFPEEPSRGKGPTIQWGVEYTVLAKTEFYTQIMNKNVNRLRRYIRPPPCNYVVLLDS